MGLKNIYFFLFIYFYTKIKRQKINFIGFLSKISIYIKGREETAGDRRQQPFATYKVLRQKSATAIGGPC